jgi:hypothetical protein
MASGKVLMPLPRTAADDQEHAVPDPQPPAPECSGPEASAVAEEAAVTEEAAVAEEPTEDPPAAAGS